MSVETVESDPAEEEMNDQDLEIEEKKLEFDVEEVSTSEAQCSF